MNPHKSEASYGVCRSQKIIPQKKLVFYVYAEVMHLVMNFKLSKRDGNNGFK